MQLCGFPRSGKNLTKNSITKDCTARVEAKDGRSAKQFAIRFACAQS